MELTYSSRYQATYLNTGLERPSMGSGDITSEVNTANVVASGRLDVELDLTSVAEDLADQLGIESVEHSRRQGNRLLIYFDEFDSLGILAPTSTTSGGYSGAATIIYGKYNYFYCK